MRLSDCLDQFGLFSFSAMGRFNIEGKRGNRNKGVMIMKKIFTLLLAALLGGYLPFGAVAGGSGQADQSAMRLDDSQIWTVLVPELYDNEYVAGVVTSLDQESGLLGLNTKVQGQIEIQVRPAALMGLKIGDAAVVFLGSSIDERTVSAESCAILAARVASC